MSQIEGIFSPLKPQRTLVPSFHLSIYPPFFDLHVIHLIYQVKGISGHQWVCVGCVRVCLGVHGCAWVCAGVYGCLRVYLGVRRYAQVCGGVPGCVWVCIGVQWVGAGVGGSARMCMGVRDCARVYVDLHGGTHAWVG